MKIEPIAYEITFPDGEIYILHRMMQSDDSILWAITEDPTGYCLGRDLKWHYEPRPSSRTDSYLKLTRFKYDEAIDIVISFRAKEKETK
jgi:hypothetical protein